MIPASRTRDRRSGSHPQKGVPPFEVGSTQEHRRPRSSIEMARQREYPVPSGRRPTACYDTIRHKLRLTAAAARMIDARPPSSNALTGHSAFASYRVRAPEDASPVGAVWTPHPVHGSGQANGPSAIELPDLNAKDDLIVQENVQRLASVVPRLCLRIRCVTGVVGI